MNSKDIKRIVHITTVDIGGAYKAVERLSKALNATGSFNSQILLRNKINPANDGTEFLQSSLMRLMSKARNGVNLLSTHGDISGDILGSDIAGHELIREADIIVIHWINSFINEHSIEKILRLDKPVYIMLHDMWHFTGGCHSDGYCGGYENGCIACPHMMASRTPAKNLSKKVALYAGRNVMVVSPSEYEASEARKSPVFKDAEIVVMGNCIDTDIFMPYDSSDVIAKYNLPTDKPLILFTSVTAGKNNKNKGFEYLLEALNRLDEDDAHLLILGSVDTESTDRIKQSFTRLGYIHDERELARLYSAADVTVVPSLQESFSYSVCESLACGTPTVSFAVSGILDQVEHCKNGYLAKFKDSEDLANGIRYCINHGESMKKTCVELAKRFNYASVAGRWQELVNSRESNIR